MSSIFRTHRSQSDRSASDRTRHHDKVEKAIRGGIADAIAEESIIGQDGNRKVKIPIRGIKEFQFIYGDNNRKVASAPGQDVKRGQKLGESQPVKQPGGKAGSDPGEESYEIEVTLAELIQYLFEKLKLPNMARKKFGKMTSERIKRSGYRKQGIRARLDKKETMIARIKRRNNAIRSGDFDPDVNERFPFHDSDKVFRHITQKPKESTNAVIFFVMDVSGSMTKEKKFLARSFFFLLYQFINTKYENTDVVFIAHTTEANECSEEQFFTRSPSGGTFISPALVKAKEIANTRYNSSDWNFYSFYCGDGDNWPEDNKNILPAFRDVVDMCQMSAYIEICPPDQPNWISSSETVMGILSPLICDKFKTMKLSLPDDVWPSLNKLFGGEILTLNNIEDAS